MESSLIPESAITTSSSEQTESGSSAHAKNAMDVPKTGYRHWWLLALVIPLLSMLPLLVMQSITLWKQLPFRFFPLPILLGTYLLASTCIAGHTAKTRTWFAIAFTALGMMMAMWGMFYLSPSRVQAGAIAVVFGWSLYHFGGTPWTRILAIGALFAITVPLPRGWDFRLMHELHMVAGWACSGFLDATSIPNVIEDSVMRIEGKRLLLNELYSDAGSLFALIAFCLGLLVVQRRSLLTGVLVLIATPCISLMCDTVRLIVIVLAWVNTGTDLTIGYFPILLGTATFLMAALFVFLAQVSVAAILAPLKPVDLRSSLEETYDQTVQWPSKIGIESVSPFAFPRIGQPLLGLLGLLCIAMAGMSVYVWFIKPQPTQLLASMDKSQASAFPAGNALPEKIGSMKKAKYFEESRKPESILGQHTHCWQYDDGETQMTVAMDFPFMGASSLPLIYDLLGWKVMDSETLVLESSPPMSIVRMKMKNRFGINGVAFHGYFDKSGNPVNHAADQLTVERRNLFSLMNSKAFDGSLNSMAASFQIQMLFETGKEMSDDRTNQSQALFLNVFEQLRQQSLPALGGAK
jgi:hypothetical protein